MQEETTKIRRRPTEVCIILTYRCQMRCRMCNIWKYPPDLYVRRFEWFTRKDL